MTSEVETQKGSATVAAVSATDDGAADIVRVSDALGQSANVVFNLELTLSVGLGIASDDRQVLMPYLDCEAQLEDEDDDANTATTRLSLDNVAYVLEQGALGFLNALRPLQSMSQGDLKPLARHIEYSAERVSVASESLREAAVMLRVMAKHGS